MQFELRMHRSNTYMYVSRDRWGVGVGGKEKYISHNNLFSSAGRGETHETVMNIKEMNLLQL